MFVVNNTIKVNSLSDTQWSMAHVHALCLSISAGAYETRNYWGGGLNWFNVHGSYDKNYVDIHTRMCFTRPRAVRKLQLDLNPLFEGFTGLEGNIGCQIMGGLCPPNLNTGGGGGGGAGAPPPPPPQPPAPTPLF